MTTDEYLQVSGFSLTEAINNTIIHCESALNGSSSNTAIVINDGQQEKITIKKLADRLLELANRTNNTDRDDINEVINNMKVKFGFIFETESEE